MTAGGVNDEQALSRQAEGEKKRKRERKEKQACGRTSQGQRRSKVGARTGDTGFGRFVSRGFPSGGARGAVSKSICAGAPNTLYGGTSEETGTDRGWIGEAPQEEKPRGAQWDA